LYTSKTPEESLRDEIQSLSKEIMGGDYISLEVQKFSLKEDFAKEEVQTNLTVRSSDSKALIKMSATGVGVVDSVYRGYSTRFSTKYASLKSIGLESFGVSVSPRDSDKTESLVSVMVEFRNSHGKVVPFRASSLCLSRSAIMSLNSAFEYYINCELCFKKLRSLIDESTTRGRFDIRESYISRIVKLVGVSSYEEVL